MHVRIRGLAMEREYPVVQPVLLVVEDPEGCSRLGSYTPQAQDIHKESDKEQLEQVQNAPWPKSIEHALALAGLEVVVDVKMQVNKKKQ